MSAASMRRPRHPASAVVVWLLVTFLVLFPKGGVKLGLLPVTWGYLLLGLSLGPLGVVRLAALPLGIKRNTLIAAASLVPFQILYVYSCLRNGIESASFASSSLVCFFVLPLAFLLVYPAFLGVVDGERLARHLRFCVLAAALFGIFLFVWHPLTGHFIEIPYLTVNADDFGQLENTKNIDRGFFLKLISTYNNGNLYGIATLILLPMYEVLEPSRWKRGVVKLALVLTLSRTVWLGLLLEQMLSLLGLAYGAARTFPRVAVGPAMRRGLVLLATLGLVLVGVALTTHNLEYIFDRGLGGRANNLVVIGEPTWLPAVPVTAFSEVLYLSALYEYGIVGLLAIMLIFALPAFLLLTDPRPVDSPTRMAAWKGIIMYMIVACSDAAASLIPVMAFYWFAYMVFLEGWPGGLELSPVLAFEAGAGGREDMPLVDRSEAKVEIKRGFES